MDKKISLNEIKNIVSKDKNAINDNSLNKERLIDQFTSEILNKIKKNENNIKEKIKKVNSVNFEKDDDDNYHINFILSFSNLRAKNYNIEITNSF